jgi:hypothetical protein
MAASSSAVSAMSIASSSRVPISRNASSTLVRLSTSVPPLGGICAEPFPLKCAVLSLLAQAALAAHES